MSTLSMWNSCSFPSIFSPQSKNVRLVSYLLSPRCMEQCVHPAPSLGITDLEVTIHSISTVKPIVETKHRTMFLSNIDQRLNFRIGSVLLFSMNESFPMQTITTKLERAYRKILVAYDYLTGRLRWSDSDYEQGRLEIECNEAGAGFVVASCNLSFEELGDLMSPRVANPQFALRKWKVERPENQPIFVMQVTSFRGGGFALGLNFNHAAMDGVSMKLFLENLASLAAENDLVLAPYNNRLRLAARSPPTVSFPHPELYKLGSLQEFNPNQMPLTATFQKLVSKFFRLSFNCIVNLKQKANIGIAPAGAHATSFNVVTAHIWRCLSMARNSKNNPEKTSTMLYAINIRSRVKPRLPTSYTGNAVLNAHCTTTYDQLEKGPFPPIVKMISDGATRMTDEYIRSIIDWGEVHKGFPCGDVMVSSWWQLRLNDVEYPWGRPKLVCPIVHNHGNNAIVLLQDVEIKGGTNGGVNILVSLPPNEMETFQRLFDELKYI